jgi:hypothetical protein
MPNISDSGKHEHTLVLFDLLQELEDRSRARGSCMCILPASLAIFVDGQHVETRVCLYVRGCRNTLDCTDILRKLFEKLNGVNWYVLYG